MYCKELCTIIALSVSMSRFWKKCFNPSLYGRNEQFFEILDRTFDIISLYYKFWKPRCGITNWNFTHCGAYLVGLKNSDEPRERIQLCLKNFPGLFFAVIVKLREWYCTFCKVLITLCLCNLVYILLTKTVIIYSPNQIVHYIQSFYHKFNHFT